MSQVIRYGRLHWLCVAYLAALVGVGARAADASEEQDSPAATPPPAAAEESITGADSPWRYFQTVELGQDKSPRRYADFLVPLDVFSQARFEVDGTSLYLGDLRLLDAAGKSVPYALRVRKPLGKSDLVSASTFNETVTSDDASEITLDLGADPEDYNEIKISPPGVDYRRRVVIDGSDDRQNWQTVAERRIAYFVDGNQKYDARTLSYHASRFRYLRVRVYRDPDVDKEPPRLSDAIEVLRTVTVPGEVATQAASIEPREPTRSSGSPASAWILDLGANHLPCDRLTVDVGDAEFARDYILEGGGPEGSDEPFIEIARGQWTRRVGEARLPMVVEFSERAVGRLRLVVVDYQNPPLDVRGATTSAAARQVVFAKGADLQGPLRLYYGNPKAEPPHYDFERNLPAQLDPPPERLTLGPREENPEFVPPPLPLTERLPWLIYAVLGAVSVALAAMIVSLGRTAVARHDAEQHVGA